MRYWIPPSHDFDVAADGPALRLGSFAGVIR
jgi:hypothetical protein